jgi:hypothetical protein
VDLPHDPPMQDLFYRLEMLGEITIRPWKTGYVLHLKQYSDSKILTSCADTFYLCLYRLWRRLEASMRQQCNKQ